MSKTKDNQTIVNRGQISSKNCIKMTIDTGFKAIAY